jgi:hypothetical protein
MHNGALSLWAERVVDTRITARIAHSVELRTKERPRPVRAGAASNIRAEASEHASETERRSEPKRTTNRAEPSFVFADEPQTIRKLSAKFAAILRLRPKRKNCDPCYQQLPLILRFRLRPPPPSEALRKIFAKNDCVRSKFPALYAAQFRNEKKQRFVRTRCP